MGQRVNQPNQDDIAEQWQVIRTLERDVELSMSAYSRVTDGLGFAAQASWLYERGWRKASQAERHAGGRPKAPGTVTKTPALHLLNTMAQEILQAVAAEHGTTVGQMLIKVRGRNTSKALPVAYRRLRAAGFTDAQIAQLVHRDRSTISKLLAAHDAEESA